MPDGQHGDDESPAGTDNIPTLAAYLDALLDARNLNQADLVRLTSDTAGCLPVSPAIVSRLLSGKQQRSDPWVLRSIALALDVDSRAVWLAAGVSCGAIAETDLSRSDCSVFDHGYSAVIPLAGQDVSPRQVVRARKAARARILAEQAKQPGSDETTP